MTDHLIFDAAEFAGKTVFITGGASGLGAACVHLFADMGARVFFCGLPAEAAAGHALAQQLSAGFRVVDVRMPDQLDDYIYQLAETDGLDIAINCAGISHPAALMADIALDDFRRVMDTNLSGIWYAMRAEIQAMAASGGLRGRAIFNISSILSVQAAGWMAAYGTAKHAVVGLSKSAAADYQSHGLRVNAISPGPLDTPMYQRALADIGGDPAKFAGGLPQDGPQNPQDIARLIAYLASSNGADITGANVVVDRHSKTGYRLL